MHLALVQPRDIGWSSRASALNFVLRAPAAGVEWAHDHAPKKVRWTVPPPPIPQHSKQRPPALHRLWHTGALKSPARGRGDAGQPSKVCHLALPCCKPRPHHGHAHCIASDLPAHVRVHLLHTLSPTRVGDNLFTHWRWRCARRSLLTHLGYSLGWRQRCTTEFAASPTSRSAARRCRSGAPRSCYRMRLCCGGQ